MISVLIEQKNPWPTGNIFEARTGTLPFGGHIMGMLMSDGEAAKELANI